MTYGTLQLHGEGFGTAIQNKTNFVICEKDKKARSRAGRLTNVSWNVKESMWKAGMTLTDDKAFIA